MPDLDFQVTGVEPVEHGLAPVLEFKLQINAPSAPQAVQALILQTQIQILAPQRRYSDDEKEKLREIFGPPEDWSRTLRNRFWTQVSITTGAFSQCARVNLQVPCSSDLNLLGTKYFSALGEADVPLLFLFSGSVFYSGNDGQLQVLRIPWQKECIFHMPLAVWRGMMRRFFPDSVLLCLRHEAFDRLSAFKREARLATWEEAIELLLRESQKAEVHA